MREIDSTSLITVAENVNEAHFNAQRITKKDARAAIDWLTSRYGQAIPRKILEAKNPNPRWAKLPRTFQLTEQDVKSGPRAFTGEPLKNASMRAIHSREAARALHLLGEVVGKPVPEAEEHCRSVRATADEVRAPGGPGLYCCGPCTASVWRLANVGALGDLGDGLDRWLEVLTAHRDGKGGWRRFPFFFTVLALSELDTPGAEAELKYVLPQCQKKRKRLKPDDAYARRRIALLDRVLERHASA